MDCAIFCPSLLGSRLWTVGWAMFWVSGGRVCRFLSSTGGKNWRWTLHCYIAGFIVPLSLPFKRNRSTKSEDSDSEGREGGGASECLQTLPWRPHTGYVERCGSP